MKKLIAIVSIVAITILALLFVVPVFFKSGILRLVQTQVSRYIRADLKIGDLGLSMFRHFPDLDVSLQEVSITGQGAFAGDTLVYIPRFEASVNLKSLLGGEEIVVNKLLLRDARIQPVVSASGQANWDMLLGDESGRDPDTAAPAPEPSSEKRLQLNDIAVENLYLAYRDFHTSTYASIADVDLQLSGNFSETSTLVQLDLGLNNISYRHENSVWVNRTDLHWQADIAADLKEKNFDIRKNSLTLNDLKLDLTGSLAVLPDRYRTDLQLTAPDTKFESLLALLPKSLQDNLKDIETSGEFRLKASVKGEYYENHLPAVEAVLAVSEASLKYPELPESIRKINLDLHVVHPGGPLDSAVIDLKKMSFDIAGNPFHLALTVLNPNDPQLSGEAKGVIDFASLKKALPLKEVTLQGMLSTDMTFRGKYQYIEKQAYEKFIAKGNVVFRDILFVNTLFPEGISIPQGRIVITPARLSLDKLQAKMYASDFTLQGYVSNYLPYIFKNETLKGDFSLISNRIDLNEFMAAQMRSRKAGTLQTDSLSPSGKQPTAAEGALEIPRNMDIHFRTDINSILFDRLQISRVAGEVTLNQAVANLKNLSMNMLNGSMIMNGQYNTGNPQAPTIDFNLNVRDFDIQAAFQSFRFVRQSIPVAMNCSGRISSAMKFSAALDREMNLVLNTANGSGYLESDGFLIRDNPAMKQLAGVFKNEELSRLSISHLKINFGLENGNITVEPFKTNLAGNPVTIYGSQTVDGQLDYTLSITVNRNFFGTEVNRLLKSIPGSQNIKTLDIDAKLGGTLAKPVLKPDLSKAVKAVTKEAEKELKGNVLKGLQGLFKKK